MIYAQVRDGKIVNVIQLDDSEKKEPFLAGFEALVKIDSLEVTPQIGWLFDGNSFSEPEEIPEKEKPHLSAKVREEAEKMASPDLSIEFIKPFSVSNLNKEIRDSIKPTQGMIILNTDSKKLEFFDGSEWVEL